MRVTLVSSLIGLMALTGCVSQKSGKPGEDNDHVSVCQDQSDQARQGKIDGGQIAISCPQHEIGDYR